MKEKPILFSGDMVRAIIEGRKTQTRRVIRAQPTDARPLNIWHPHGRAMDGARFTNVQLYAEAGDLLWVREMWAPCGDGGVVWYRAGIPGFRAGKKTGEWFDYPYTLGKTFSPPDDLEWRPSIYMPRWASRITLRVNNVRVERVQDISDDDAIAEGIKVYVPVPGDGLPAPRLQFKNLWDSINAKRGYGWDNNPWVWVVGFEVVR